MRTTHAGDDVSPLRRRYTAKEFKRGAARSRMAIDSIALARAVLVDGLPPATVAETQQVTRQWVFMAVSKMRNYIEDANPIPTGWAADVVTLPKADWVKVRNIERAARARLHARINAT